jgi:hypothetical protein
MSTNEMAGGFDGVPDMIADSSDESDKEIAFLDMAARLKKQTFTGLGRSLRVAPGWNGLYWKFIGLQWILLELHQAGMDFTGDSPGWNGLYWNFTGLEWILLEIHRAGMDFTGDSPGCYETRNVHRAGMDFTGDSSGWNGFYWRFTGLE